MTTRACASCNYDLAGLPQGCTCPECGSESSVFDAHNTQTLDAFTICPTCGYNLAGLPRTSQCPECGSPSQDAIIEHSIYRTGSAHVATLARGASLIILAHYLFFASFLAMFIGIIFAGAIGTRSGMNAGPMGGVILGMALYLGLLLASGIVWLVGWLKATKKDPVFGFYAESENRRAKTRAMAITLFSLTATMIVCSIVPLANILVVLALFVCGIIMFYFSTAYIRQLALRIPSPKLAATATRMRVAGTIIFIYNGFAIVTMILLMIAATNTNNRDFEIVAMVIYLSIFIAALIGLLTYIRVLARFASIMKQTKQRAESTPTHGTTPPGVHLQTFTNNPNPATQTPPSHVTPNPSDINRIT